MESEEVQVNDETDSEPLPEGRKSDSVFDFLYHDARRVGSFLSQFETYGVPSQIKATESVGQVATQKTTFGGNLKLPLVASGQANLDLIAVDEERDSAERTFDPLWSNARRLLDYLSENSLIQRDVWAARTGQIVLVKGIIVILDLAMLKDMYKDKVLGALIRTGMGQGSAAPNLKPNRAERRKNGINQGQPSQPDEADFAIALLSMLPHQVQARLYGETYRVWFSIPEANLVGTSSDLMLKHGSIIQGDWNVLGVLDAIPDGTDDVAVPNVDEELAKMLGGSPVGVVAAHMGPIARQMLGRPPNSFGITPLLIFREVLG